MVQKQLVLQLLIELKNLVIDGVGNTLVNPKVYAKTLTLDSGNVRFAHSLDMGAGSMINVNDNVIVRGNIDNSVVALLLIWVTRR